MISVFIALLFISCNGSTDFYGIEDANSIASGSSQVSSDDKKLDSEDGLLPKEKEPDTAGSPNTPDGESKKKEPKDCSHFSQEFIGDLGTRDIMTELNYDADKIDEFICDNDKLVICHVPPGNSNAAHFIEIGDSLKALETHLDKKHISKDSTHRSYLVRCSVYREQDLRDAELCGVICI